MPVSFMWSNVDCFSCSLHVGLFCSFQKRGLWIHFHSARGCRQSPAHARGEVAIFSTSYLLSLCGDMKGNSFFSFVVFHMVTVMCFAATRKSLLCLAGAGLMKEVHHVGKSPMTKDLLTDLTERKGQLRFQ